MTKIIDYFIALLLVVTILWCGLLFWSAFSQHRSVVLLNEDVLLKITSSIEKQVAGTAPAPNPKTIKEIERLEKAQHELFDSNTVSFLFQFVTLLLLTIGGAVLGLTYKHLRNAREEAENSRKQLEAIQEFWPKFVGGINAGNTFAVKYGLLWTLSTLYESASDNMQREKWQIMMMDWQKDIERYLVEVIVPEKRGLDPEMSELIDDLARHVDHKLRGIGNQAEGTEETLIQNIIASSANCVDILWKHGRGFSERYEVQFKKIMGQE